jgi:hypothetical protein
VSERRLSARSGDEAAGRAPDIFIRGSDPKTHPHYYCDLAGLATALRRLRASVANSGGAAPPGLLTLAGPRRTAMNPGRPFQVRGAVEQRELLQNRRLPRSFRYSKNIIMTIGTSSRRKR